MGVPTPIKMVVKEIAESGNNTLKSNHPTNFPVTIFREL
jgi:hypothetical protein